MMQRRRLLALLIVLAGLAVFLSMILAGSEEAAMAETSPYLLVLGIAQDAGVPQAGRRDHPGWEDPSRRRLAVSLALVDEVTGRRYLFDATPDFKFQLARLDRAAPVEASPGIDGIFLTHAHIGHYTGLMMLGREVMGSRGVPVYAMPRMAEFLRSNGPWSQLVRYQNIELRPLQDGTAVVLGPSLKVTPLLVPHRPEFSEVVGFRIEGPRRSALYLPDIDRWEDWDLRLEDVLASVDVAYVDGCFYAHGEVGGRDMSTIPHPPVTTTMNRLAKEPLETRQKIRFIHINHTNPVLVPGSAERGEVAARGFRLAEEGEIFDL